jgi:hypothetical protein
LGRGALRHPWRAAAALLLAAQAPAPGLTLSLAELRETPPAVLAHRLIGSDGRSVSHRRLCAMVEGTRCNGFGLGTIILSTDFEPTAYPHLCVADQWTTVGRSGGIDSVTLEQPVRSRAFRLGSPCRGAPNPQLSHGDFTIFTSGEATPADAWNILQAARRVRVALAEHTIPVDCHASSLESAKLCANPADVFAETKLSTMYKAVVKKGKDGADILRLELWGGNALTNTATYVWADLHLDRGYGSTRSIVIRRVEIKEYPFVD